MVAVPTLAASPGMTSAYAHVREAMLKLATRLGYALTSEQTTGFFTRILYSKVQSVPSATLLPTL